jgi:four helix bundle protein
MSISENQDISRQNIGKSVDRGKTVPGFEKLWVWQKAHALRLKISSLRKILPISERFKVIDQIERSSSSVADNIAEGHTSYYYQDKIKGFYVARKEAGETQSHIRALEGKGYLISKTANELILSYEEVIRGINGYVRWVREKRERGK